jgi:hypothetical protein
MSPKTNVILLTCNRTSYLQEALKGLAGQSRQDWVLTASDCSTNAAARAEIQGILEQHRRNYPEHQIRIIQQTEQVPQAEHLRRALVTVDKDTPYVALLDDDDIWLPEHLERACSWLEQNLRHGLAVSNGRIIDADGTITLNFTSSREDPLPASDDRAAWLRLFMSSFFGSTSGLVFRAAAIAKHTFIRTSMVDVHLALSVLLNDYKVIGFPEPSYLYRVHEGSSYQKGLQVVRDRNDLRLALFRSQGLQIIQKYPFFLFLVAKSAMSRLRGIG